MNALTRDLVKLVDIAEKNQKAKEELSASDRKFREKLHLMPAGWLAERSKRTLSVSGNLSCILPVFPIQPGRQA